MLIPIFTSNFYDNRWLGSIKPLDGSFTNIKKNTKNKYTKKVWHAYIQYPVDCKNENELMFFKLYVPIFIGLLLFSKLCCIYLIVLFYLAWYLKTVTFKLDKKAFKTYINFWNFQLWITGISGKNMFFLDHTD